MSQVTEPTVVEPTPVPMAAHKSRFLFPWALVLLFWGITFGLRAIELPFFVRFLSGMALPALFLIAFTVWWWRHRSVSWRERLFSYILILGGAFAFSPLTHPSLGIFHELMFGVPLMMSVFIVWMFFAERSHLSYRWAGTLVVAMLTWSSSMLLRMDGLDGDLKPTMLWRWSPSAEEKFLAEQKSVPPAEKPAPTKVKLELTTGDWPQFRGVNRDGVVTGTSIATNWNEQPPKLLWKERVGPAWSAVTVIGDLLFTQEQRGEREAVVCYNASTGKEVWVHEDDGRFYEAVSGAGPRATPTFADGKIYTLGSTGILNCLDASTGKKQWSHNLVIDANAVVPMWGLSSSPLVTDGAVVVYGGGENQSNLIAYAADSGKELWRAPAGTQSYASAQLGTICGKSQIMVLSDQGLTSVEPEQGKVLWNAPRPTQGPPPSLQPHVIDDNHVVIATLVGMGIGMLDVTHAKGTWTPTQKWDSQQVKAEFSEYVIHEGHAYGFDGAIFCCVDLDSGKRQWKKGRYGRGQVILLADQALLLILSETGDAVLLAANPAKHDELGRFAAVEGKCWNHPVVAHNRLFVRNAEEMACYELAPAGK